MSVGSNENEGGEEAEARGGFLNGHRFSLAFWVQSRHATETLCG
jgi:hypothetical protein